MKVLSTGPRLAAALTAAAAVAAAVGVAAAPAHAAEIHSLNAAMSSRQADDGPGGNWGDDGEDNGTGQPVLVFTGDNDHPTFVNAHDNGNRTALDNGNQTALDNGNTDRSVHVAPVNPGDDDN